MLMKNLLFICFCLLSIGVFGQTPKAIEDEMVKSYKKLTYWAVHSKYDSLEKANDVLGFKLKNYTAKSPSTITYPFPLLSKDLDISTSTDGMFRIYSWDMLTGGTMHFFANVFQYKSKNRTRSFLDTPKGDGDNRPNYYKMYTFKAGNQTYYLAVWLGIGSTKAGMNGVKVFAIVDEKLTDNVKLIKTSTGIHNQLSYEYNNGWEDKFDINFDSISKTIRVPLLTSNSKPTSKFITYKFTGKYFERVKN